MAFTWGPHLLASGESGNYELNYAAADDLLPYISVVPLGPAFLGQIDGSPSQSYSGGFPVFNMLGVSTQFCYMSDDETTVHYYINVMNNGPFNASFNIVYTDF